MARKASTTASAPRDTRSAIEALPPAEPEEVADSAGIRLRRVLGENWIVGVLLVLIPAFTVASPAFFSQANWLNVSSTAVYVCLLAMTQTLLVIAGAIDLSQGAIMGFSGVIAGSVISNLTGGVDSPHAAWVIALAFVIALAAGAVCGLVNGLVIAISRLNPFIVTLGSYQAYTGLANLVANGQDITSLPPQISLIGNTNLFGWISIPVLVTAVIFLILAVMLRKTRFGKYVYVIGDSQEAAVRAGIKVKRQMVILFTLSGTVSAVAGILEMTRLADASPSAGSELLLNSIAATIIGGTSLAGGRGSIGRTIVGGLIISTLLIGLVISNVQPYWQQVTIGAVIVLAVFIDEKGKGFGEWRRRIYVRQ